MTGVHVNWEYFPDDGLAEKKNIRIVSNDLPDVFLGCAFSKVEQFKYGEDGTLVDMIPYVTPEIMPNYYIVKEKYKSVRKGATTPEGKLFSLPTIFDHDTKELIIGVRMHIRSDWLKLVDMERPNNLEELYQMLKAFYTKDPNANGKADEYPLACYTNFGSALSATAGAFELNTRGASSPFDWDEEKQAIRFPKVSENYKEQLMYFNRLWKENLINHDTLTLKTADFIALATQEPRILGVICGGGGPNIYGVGNEYEGSNVIESESGAKMWNTAYAELVSTGNFVITKTNKKPAQTLHWYDYIYSKEGSILHFLGKEGETFYVNKDGKRRFVEDITNNPNGLTLDQAIGRYLSWPGGYYAAMIYDGVFQGSEAQPEAYEAALRVWDYIPKEIWPGFSYTLDENEILSSTGTDINTYVSECTAKFITGEMSFAEWDNYVKTIEKMGLKSLMDVYQAALDRYNKD